MFQNAGHLSFTLCIYSFLGRGFVGVGRASLPHMGVGRGPIGPSGPMSPIAAPFSLASAASISEESPIVPGKPTKVEVKIEIVKYEFFQSPLIVILDHFKQVNTLYVICSIYNGQRLGSVRYTF